MMPAKRMLTETSSIVNPEVWVATAEDHIASIIFAAHIYTSCLTILILVATYLLIHYTNKLEI